MSNQASNPLPHSRSAEEAVLGSVLIGASDVFHPVRMKMPCGVEEFYIIRHQWIWQAFAALISRNAPIDLLTVADELEAKGQLGEAGGPAYLTTLVNQVPTTLNAEEYANIVHGHYIRRQAIYGANEAASLAYDETLSTEEAAARAIKSITDRVGITAQGRIAGIDLVAGSAYDLIEANAKLPYLPGIQSGLIDLDEYLGGGWQKSDLILVSARPGGGKTSLLLQLAKHAARYTEGTTLFTNNVLFFSAEMPAQQLVLRMASGITGIDYQRLRTGRVPADDWAKVTGAVEELAALCIEIDDTPMSTIDQIESRCEVMASQGKLDIVFVDYLQLVRSGMKFSKSTEEIDYVARRLKGIARRFNIPVIVAHQMNRFIEHRSEDSRPQLSDLNEGGEKDPDIVLFIWSRPQENREPDYKLVLAKHRNGPTGDVDVVFRKANTRFESSALKVMR